MQNLRSKSRWSRGLLLLALVSAPAFADEGPSPGALQKRIETPPPATATQPAVVAPAPAPAPAPAANPAPGQPDKDGFVQENRPMMGPTVDESIPAGPLLATAYGFVWLAVLGYVVMIGRGLRRVDSELNELDQKLGKLASKS